MKGFQQILDSISGFIWGPFLLVPLLLLVGVVLMIMLRFMPWRELPHAFATMWRGRKHDPEHEGEITPFRALMTSLAATVGTGNIVGVASAIILGGPGAIFWMWMTAAFGMATKFCEATLAVKYREVTLDGKFVGGPMYYIKNGLGNNWKWLATIFAIFGVIASFGIGNMTQANAVTGNIVNLGTQYNLGISPIIIAVVLLVLSGAVLIGGVKRIGAVSGTLVPVMSTIYVVGAIIILIFNYDKVPGALASIFQSAFTGQAALGGITGKIIMDTIQAGVARGLFSNEAGLGSAPIAHATAIVKHPVKQGLLGMIDPFIDTIIICTMSALVILVAGDLKYNEVNITLQAEQTDSVSDTPHIFAGTSHKTKIRFRSNKAFGSAPDVFSDQRATLILPDTAKGKITKKAETFLCETEFGNWNQNQVRLSENGRFLLLGGTEDDKPFVALYNIDECSGALAESRSVLQDPFADDAAPPPIIKEITRYAINGPWAIKDSKLVVGSECSGTDLASCSEIKSHALPRRWMETDLSKVAKGVLTADSFQATMGTPGTWLVTTGLVLFAFSTILGWCVYGERCAIYLFGHKAALPYRVFFTLVVPVGALTQLDIAWAFADIANGLMAIPNLIALLLLSPIVIKLSKEYFEKHKHADSDDADSNDK